MVVITPALAGPFDLGTVVVQVALILEPETAQIHPVAEVPHVFGGAKLDVRSVFVNVNRKEFALNGTNCRQNATAGVAAGRRRRPDQPGGLLRRRVSSPFQLKGCGRWNSARGWACASTGKRSRAEHPKLRAVLIARAGDANIARASVAPAARALPRPGQPRRKSARGSNSKPRNVRRSSIYGFAAARRRCSANRSKARSSCAPPNHTLPDLVAHLEGQVDIDLVGRIDSYKGGIRTTFDTVPDVPVTKFVMILPGGKHGLLESSTNLCAKPVRAIVQLKGQNGKTANKHQRFCDALQKREESMHRKRPPSHS